MAIQLRVNIQLAASFNKEEKNGIDFVWHAIKIGIQFVVFFF